MLSLLKCVVKKQEEKKDSENGGLGDRFYTMENLKKTMTK